MTEPAKDWMMENDVDPDVYEAFLDGVEFGIYAGGSIEELDIENVREAYIDFRERNNA